MLATPQSHQCYHKPVKHKKNDKKDFFKGLNTQQLFSSPKTCYELLSIASEESTRGRQKCTLRELEMHSQAVVQM